MTAERRTATCAAPEPTAPAARESAWRNPFVWLVVGLPGSVVLASLVTAYIAVSGADTVVTAREPGKVIQEVDPMLPALKARNRAAEARSDSAPTP